MKRTHAFAKLGSAMLALASQCAFANAPAPAAPADGYFRALGFVMVKIRGPQYTADICAARYPETRAANQQAADEWRLRYKPFIDEMTGHFEGLPKYWASLDARTAKAGPQLWKTVNRQLDAGRTILEQQYMAQLGEEKFALVCERYPLTLQSYDLERMHAAEVATIRRKPK